MRRVYLIRHGEPECPGSGSFCIGRADFPLSALGRSQAKAAAAILQKRELSRVFTSPLLRAVQTAAAFGEYTVIPQLAEQNMGSWDGLPFSEIRDRWPRLYALRGEDPLLVPPGAETMAECSLRFAEAVAMAAADSCNDIAIVAHASVIRGFLCWILDKPLSEHRSILLPYGSITELLLDQGQWSVIKIGENGL